MRQQIWIPPILLWLSAVWFMLGLALSILLLQNWALGLVLLLQGIVLAIILALLLRRAFSIKPAQTRWLAGLLLGFYLFAFLIMDPVAIRDLLPFQIVFVGSSGFAFLALLWSFFIKDK